MSLSLTIPAASAAYSYMQGLRLPEPGMGAVLFTVRGTNDVHVAFGTEPNITAPMYEILLGGWANTVSGIRKARGGPIFGEQYNGNIINAGVDNYFWISLNSQTKEIQVGRGAVVGQQVFLSWVDPNFIAGAVYVCFSSFDTELKYSDIRITTLAGLAEQTGWRRCNRCTGLYHGAGESLSCPAGTGGHDSAGSLDFGVFMDTRMDGGARQGFRWCNKCKGLFYGAGSDGNCSSGGTHSSTGSGHYVLTSSDKLPIRSVGGWRYCTKCRGVFSVAGKCAGGTVDVPNHVLDATVYQVHDQGGDPGGPLLLNEHMVLDLDGYASGVDLPPSDFDWSNGFTIEAWLRVRAGQTWSRIYECSDESGGERVFLLLGNTANIGIAVYNAGVEKALYSAANTLEVERWVHIAVTVNDAGLTTIYKNGQVLHSGTTQLPINLLRKKCAIGNAQPAAALNGMISELRIWSGARTQAEVQSTLRVRLVGDEPGLLSCWPLNDGGVSGGFTADAKGELAGALRTYASFSQQLLPLNLPAGWAPPSTSVVQIDGQGGRIDLAPVEQDLSMGLTMEAWIWTTHLRADNWRILALSDSQEKEYIHFCFQSSSNSLGAYIRKAGGAVQSASSVNGSIACERWVHVAMTVDATGVTRLFRDGRQIQVGTLTGPANVYRNICTIGSGVNATSSFSGSVAEVRLWKSARSVSEIRRDMRSRLRGDEAGLIGYWPLCDGSGPFAMDAATGKSATLTSGTNWTRSPLQLLGTAAGVNSVSHEGKVVVFATGRDGKVRYSVKQAGFEDSALLGTAVVKGWENWQELNLPDEPNDDASVVKVEQKTRTYKSNPSRYILRSRYRTKTETAAAPIQGVSALGHLYVFRQSLTGTLLCDRFILDGMTNKLVPKLQVRFKRSGQRYEPKELAPGTAANADNLDSLDFTDMLGHYFYEPTTELCVVSGLRGGQFSVAMVPTVDNDHARWHFFWTKSDGSGVEVLSLRSSEEGLFDVADHRSVVDRAPIAGILRTTLKIKNSAGVFAKITNGPAAARYDVQEERMAADGTLQLVRTATRMMLAIPTDQGTATLSFAMSTDGLLADLRAGKSNVPVRSDEKELMLPLSDLDDIRAFGADAPKQGPIVKMERGADNRVVITSDADHALKSGDVVRLKSTKPVNGTYTVTLVDEHTFDIDAADLDATFAASGVGRWEQIKEEQTGETFDGAITSYEKTADGKLRVTAFNHQLSEENPVELQVQISGTSGSNGSYPITREGNTSFALDANFKVGMAVNTAAQTRKRRGLRLAGGQGQYVSVPKLVPPMGNDSYTMEAWIKPARMGALTIMSWGSHQVANQLNRLRLTDTGLANGWGDSALESPNQSLAGVWHHVAATYDGGTKIQRLFIDGKQVATRTLSQSRPKPATPNQTPLTLGTSSSQDDLFEGHLAEVRLWNIARTETQIHGSLHLQLNGGEAGLLGYWPLGAILDGPERTVVDLSTGGNFDGIVNGAAYVASMPLLRQPTGWPVNQEAVGFRNDELIPVTQGMKYEESFEYKADKPQASFNFSYWFQRSRDNDERVEFAPSLIEPSIPEPVPGDAGWYKATCTFTAPEGATLVRLFEIRDFGPALPPGDANRWTQLEVRRHRIRALPAPVSEQKGNAEIQLNPEADWLSTQQQQSLTTIDAKLREEGELLIEREILEEKIFIGDNLAATAALIQAKKNEINTKKGELAGLVSELGQWEAKRLEFFCRFTPQHATNKAVELLGSAKTPDSQIAIWDYVGGANQHFRCIALGNEIYKVASQDSGLFLAAHGGSQAEEAQIRQYAEEDTNHFKFQFILKDSAHTYVIKALHSSKVWDIYDGDGGNGARLIQYGEHGGANQRFKVDIVGDSPKVMQRRNAIKALEELIRNLQAELALLEAAYAEAAARLAEWKARRDYIDLTLLPPLGQALITASTDVSSAVLPAPTLNTVDATAPLNVRGARLLAIRPKGRISAMESAEGCVKLGYADAQGRLRIASYETVAGSSSGGSACWRLPRLASFINFDSTNKKLLLPASITLPAEWSIEAWVHAPMLHYPLPKGDYRTLACGALDAQLIIDKKGELGIWLGGEQKFYPCGFNVRRLSIGWHHFAVVASGTGQNSTTNFYVNGGYVGDCRTYSLARQRIIVGTATTANRPAAEAELARLEGLPYRSQHQISCFGNNSGDNQPFGRIAEVRLWSCALRPVEVLMHSRTAITGNEPGLLADYTMRKNPADPTKVLDGRDHVTAATLVGAPSAISCAAPIGSVGNGDSACLAEYSTITLRPGTSERMAMMRSAMLCTNEVGVARFADQRIEELELLWLGNAQFKPTLLGYIEGAPPVPSENLTVEENYNDATSVELSITNEKTYSWNRSKSNELGSDVTFFLGANLEKDLNGTSFLDIANIAAPTNKLYQIKAGFRGTFSDSRGESAETSVSAQSSETLTDRLALRGSLEKEAKFELLGRRFVPKNVGYALVVSGLADVFVTRLQRTGRMIGYEVVPDPNRPLDVNTITFLINPAYTMNGSLDGLTGSRATSQRFHRHVPAMRAQYGSKYPASYYRLDEAYALKQEIEQKDKERDSYFWNFDANSLSEYLNLGASGGSAADREMDSRVGEGSTTETGVPDESESNEQIKKRQDEIKRRSSDLSEMVAANAALQNWQQRMANLQVGAGKRNIVNTYVWDADGGLHSEAQQFMNSIEHTIGSSMQSSYQAGFEGFGFYTGVGGELTALATMSWSETLTKTASSGRGFGLNISLDGVECTGVTDFKDRPLVPGEKVNRYRFMSFYLEGKTDHFKDFFSQVVDPEWLQGNSESARALRQIDQTKPNKSWRVLHRVTYVERPALANFGQDHRPLTTYTPPQPSLEEQVKEIFDYLKSKLP